MLFQQAFLDNIRRNGRLCELELIGVFKTKAFLADQVFRCLMKDALLAPQLMKRSKFHLRGERVQDRGIVERIFKKCEQAMAVSPSAAPSSNGSHHVRTKTAHRGHRLLSRLCLARIVERL